MTRFDDAIGLRPLDEHRFAWTVPDGWQQGRGAWGGLIAGAVTQAALEVEGDSGRAVRTVSIHMSGPVPVGEAVVRAEPIRRGSAMSTWAITVANPAGVLHVHAVVVTGLERAADLAAQWSTWGVVDAPDLPTWDRTPTAVLGPPLGPPFGEHLEYRPVTGAPFGQAAARCSGWVRFADQEEWSAPQLLGLVDAWWPAAYAALAAPRPMATVAFAAHLLVDPQSVACGEPLRYESHVEAARDGFTTETRRLWTVDGRLAVANHQSIVVIR